MIQYTDFQGTTHLAMSDNHLTQIMRKEIMELRLQLIERDTTIENLSKQVKVLEHAVVLLG